MLASKRLAVLCILLCLFPKGVGGGWYCTATCISVVGVLGFLGGGVVLSLLGFTASGIAAGSWAASWMAGFGGAVPAGSLFATLQSMAAAGATKISLGAFGGLSAFCASLCSPLS
ncbi:interferon alpha-inducible protein 27-like protein 2A isoform X2 [Dreissena polymorpha]|nr:interferon alpha-inducible protein 27-like protein 2A isoform X2 [Dreissena polymorpha]XP_052272887.1 interferon alpha-inducible protein 27-like protein 2A isoform X2 [Dreissena polymorpha]XP_052272888.1 interferon alpha-inducible protein 27-like protein 2A isoform X2 [Dreissena polymorpha]XP_052272889.1 interferon alpha-inducible protein 27-like protein 2A isoform X2 [Dreissena polymorpha]XP_052272890.1 interferon alpha-inducible protein 27-like protein 2A isoform X2 [Dreissena polymorpha]